LIDGGSTWVNMEVAFVDNRQGPDTPELVAVGMAAGMDLGIDTPHSSSVGQQIQYRR